MMGLLHTGYEMPLSREVKIAKKIKNNELGWFSDDFLDTASPAGLLAQKRQAVAGQYTD
jgi:Golgi nucleoside diphosphatase